MEEESAELALQKLTGRFYQGRMLQPEFCPVSDFKEPVCRQFDEAKCNRGGSARFEGVAGCSEWYFEWCCRLF